MTAKMIKVGFLVAAAIGIFARNASAEECNACHSGQKLPPMEKELKIEMPAPAPTIAIPEYSAHAGIDCQDCHAGANAMPHPPKMPAVNCNICHSDMVGDLGGSSHGAKLSKYLAKTGGEVKLSEICLACHGSDVHSVRKTDDPLSPVARANLAGACLKCHDQVEPIAIKQYVASIHGKACAKGNLKAAVCSDCHGSHAINHSKMTNSQVYREAVPDTCGKCHEQAAKEYKESIHWKVVQEGFKDAPICTDCHGEHGIRSRKDPLSATFSANITMTCAHCHESELINTKFMIPKGRVKTFMGSFHGLSGSLGDVRVANCSSCHGNHDILPASDPKSSVNSANLGQTCGKCHPGAESRFISEPIHKKREESSRLVMWVRNLYIVMIGLTLGGMLFHNSLDLAFKTTKGMPFRRREKIIPRLNLNERIQHLFLFLSFSARAYSGFVLKFPDSLIALPFRLLVEGAGARRWIHRGAAIAFVLLALYHIFYLLFTERGREQLSAIFPKPKDVRDAITVMLHRYILRRPMPPLEMEHYSYIEKAEYWALIWGSVVMVLTGVLLAFFNLAIARMPMWVISLAGTIHFYEAILAVSAIFVWHFYWSVFDPEVYPMNWIWILGKPFVAKIRLAEAEHEEAAPEPAQAAEPAPEVEYTLNGLPPTGDK